MQNFYTTPASELNITARELVRNRIAKLAELSARGKSIKMTAMTAAFMEAI